MSDPYAKPATDATLTIRVIKSFPHRTCKNVVLHHVDLTRETAGGLKATVRAHVAAAPGFKAYRAVPLDTLKLYSKAHGTKTQNLIINLEDADDRTLFGDDAATLASYGCEHETEVSFFNGKDYEDFKANPEEKWSN